MTIKEISNALEGKFELQSVQVITTFIIKVNGATVNVHYKDNEFFRMDIDGENKKAVCDILHPDVLNKTAKENQKSKKK